MPGSFKNKRFTAKGNSNNSPCIPVWTKSEPLKKLTSRCLFLPRALPPAYCGRQHPHRPGVHISWPNW